VTKPHANNTFQNTNTAKRAKALDNHEQSPRNTISTTRWILTIACALLSGLITVVIVSATEKLVAWRTRTLANWLSMSNNDNSTFFWSVIFVAYCLLSLVLAGVASALCLYWPGIPEAVGSGIPEVKAYLNGIRVKKFNNPTLIIIKIVGSVLSVGSSMAVGMEGPLVMIGACAGASLAHSGNILGKSVLKIKELKNRWKYGREGDNWSPNGKSDPILNWLWVWATTDLYYFANDEERRKLITIGAACGFAASFGAPIGGMLFIMESVSTFFNKNMFLRILVANSVGTFCLAYYRGNLTQYGAIEFGSYSGGDDDTIGERFREIPFWIIMGIVGGVLGGWFCKAFGDLKKSSGKKFNTKGLKMYRISFWSLVNSIVMFLLPSMKCFCRGNNADNPAAAEQQFFCEIGETNEMATIFFGSRGKAIVRILSDPGQFYASTLVIVGFVFYILMLVTNTNAIPSGLFTPIVVSGASLGGAYGLFLQQYVDENINPSAFALMGVGAMMTGIQRTTVSTCVILVEGTGQMKILLPVMFVVVIANYVAHLIYEDGVYDVLVKLKGYPYLDHSKDGCYDVFLVRDIMSKPLVTVREKETAIRLVEILRNTSHNGFPVVDEHGRLKGLVRRKQIVALMECGIFEKADPGKGSIRNNIFDSTSIYQSNSGRNGNGLMRLAYRIKDDRYGDIEESDEHEERTPSAPPQIVSAQGERNPKSKWNLIKVGVKVNTVLNEKRLLGADVTMPAVDASKLDSSNFFRDDDSDAGIDGRGDDIDSDDEESEDAEDLSKVGYYKVNKNDVSVNQSTKDSILWSNTDVKAPKGFVRVGLNRKNHVVVISWLNPEYKDDLIDLEAVMNRGTYIVPEHFPLSKAYNLFTLLGLRWIVVVGGVNGGAVVGLLTRESFVESYLKMKTGLDARTFR